MERLIRVAGYMGIAGGLVVIITGFREMVGNFRACDTDQMETLLLTELVILGCASVLISVGLIRGDK